MSKTSDCALIKNTPEKFKPYIGTTRVTGILYHICSGLFNGKTPNKRCADCDKFIDNYK